MFLTAVARLIAVLVGSGAIGVVAGTALSWPFARATAASLGLRSGEDERMAETAAAPAEGPGAKGPVGWDAYRRLDRLPQLPVGVRTRQFSSFDRTGGNNDGTTGDFSCLRTMPSQCLLAEHDGPGEIASIWFTRDEGDVTRTGDLRIELDGRLVLAAPLQQLVNGDLGPPFVYPLVANADQSSGGVYVKVPMPYRQSMRVYTTENPLFYSVVYRVFPDDVGVATFDPADQATDVLAMLAAAGTRDPKPPQPAAHVVTREFTLAPGATVTLARLTGPGVITALRVRLPQTADRPGVSAGTWAGGSVKVQLRVDPRNEGVRVILRTPLDAGPQRAAVLLDGQPAGTFGPPVEHAGDGADPERAAANEQVLDLPADLTADKERVDLANVLLVPNGMIVVESIIDGVPVRTDELAADRLSVPPPAKEASPGTPAPEGTGSSGASDTPVGAPSPGVRLRIAFDGRWTVDSPLSEFFGAGLGRDSGPVAALLFAVDADGWHSAWWPMPYSASATVELHNGSAEALTAGVAEVTAAPAAATPAGDVAPDRVAGYFSATAAQGPTAPGRDWVFLDARGIGKVVGVSSRMAGAGPGRAYLEGDERVLVDGTRSPALHGTGTEDFYGGGWYFNRGPFSAPLNGATAHHVAAPGCPFECDAAYRILLADAISFEAAVRFGIEHGPRNQEAGAYASTTFWYGRPEFGLRRVGIRDVGDGDADAETTAASTSTAHAGAEALTATFEGEDDAIPVIDEGRATSGETTFKVSIHPDNRGMMLRRLSDQAIGGQAARVYVDDVDVGVWRQPLHNTRHRWLEDEFPLPAVTTRGRDRIAVRVAPLPGAPDWHAARYEALSHVSAFGDAAGPGVVQGLEAHGGESNTVTLSWKPAVGDLPAVRYQVFAATARGVKPRPENLVGETGVSGFVHTDLGLDQSVFYRVLAVDAAGSLGHASDEVTTTTGTTLQLEAEALLPPESATASVIAQDMGGFGEGWSAGQLLFQAVQPGDEMTVAFDVPTTGHYALFVAPTHGRDYGIFLLSVDGVQIGDAFDGYGPGVAPAGPVGFGELGLVAGPHALTLTITAKTAASLGHYAGLDYVQLNLLRFGQSPEEQAGRRASVMRSPPRWVPGNAARLNP